MLLKVFIISASFLNCAVVGAIQAQAASFDCTKAGTAFEHAICGNADLSRMDESLAAAYKEARAGLSERASERLVASQSEWLDYANRACTDKAEPQSEPYDEQGQLCLSDIFESRMLELQNYAPEMFEGRRFFQVARFRVLPDTDAEPDSFYRVAKATLRYPLIDGDSLEAWSFNRFVEGLVSPVSSNWDFDTDASTDTDLELRVTAVTPAMITVDEVSYFYGHGAAHGNYALLQHHFLVPAQRPLATSDVFFGEDWPAALKPMIIEVLKDELGEDGVWEDLDGLERSIADPATWQFSEQGMGFQFQPYEVTAYAAGAPVAQLGWTQLEPYITDEARALVGF